jgi:heme/copper-type cytochrome/quinol oxidase subunit 2
MTKPRAAMLLLLLVPLLLQGASLPHTHFGGPDGFFNEEHDLTLLAALSAVAPLTGVVFVLVLLLMVAALAAAARSEAPAPALVAADSRAPPTR